jgi:2-polyprenyl-6-methoxyphenol hydroxylase-like FAD-dependent oxidoreductase
MTFETKKRMCVGIIGAGTAGLAAAIAFSRLGHEVHVFEKHHSLTSLGAGLLIQPQGVRALTSLGVGEAFNAASVPVDRLLGLSHRGWRLVDVPYAEGEARAVSRAALSSLLYQAAAAEGVAVHFGVAVTGVEAVGERAVAYMGKHAAIFDLIVLADGAASPLPSKAGLAVSSKPYRWGALWGMFDVEDWSGARVLEQRYRTTRQMFGLMPTEQVGDKLRLSLFWSLPREAYASWMKTPLDKWKQELLSLWPESAPVVNQITSHDQLTFASYRHANPKRLAKAPLCVIGDAAHAMSPQLGLGSTLAVQDALMLAQQVEERGLVEGLGAFSSERLRVVRAYQLLSRVLTPCFQADGAGLWRDALFAFGLAVPGVQQLMYRSVAEPNPSGSRV